MSFIQANNVNMVAHSDILSTGIASAGHLTADGLLVYLSSRLNSIDDQINTIMAKQKATESARKHVAEIHNIFAKYKPGDAMTPEDRATINYHLQSLGDASLSNKLSESLGVPMNEITEDKNVVKGLAIPPETEGLKIGKGEYKKPNELDETELQSAETVIENTLSAFESSASLDMIQLQSLMSARNTAISLATNMMSAVGKGLESIVGNIGR